MKLPRSTIDATIEEWETIDEEKRILLKKIETGRAVGGVVVLEGIVCRICGKSKPCTVWQISKKDAKQTCLECRSEKGRRFELERKQFTEKARAWAIANPVNNEYKEPSEKVYHPSKNRKPSLNEELDIIPEAARRRKNL